MRKLRVTRPGTRRDRCARPVWDWCRVTVRRIETGERIKRGCGRRGLVPDGAGWRCFYCGNYRYRDDPTLSDLWFHFRTAREYWRAIRRGDRCFINGVPVAGPPDPLPPALLADLAEPDPPDWFLYYMVFDEEQFNRYLEAKGHAAIET